MVLLFQYNPLDLFYWGHVKDEIFLPAVGSVVELHA
jgi:hypothetical protein